MTREEQHTIMNRAVWAYGPEMQEMKCVEELGELTQALMKAIVAAKSQTMEDFLDAVDHVFEEIADVEIMLGQLRLIWGDAPERIDEWKARKLERLSHRLDDRRHGL